MAIFSMQYVYYCIVLSTGGEMENLSVLHHEVLMLLERERASYAQPISSGDIGKALNITPSYIRSQMVILVRERLIGVRRGNGGGYYIVRED